MPSIYIALPLLLLIASHSAGVHAQEPAFISNTHVVRYEETPGFFHYVYPCRMPDKDAAQPTGSTTPTNLPPAVCWPVLLGQVLDANGKPVSSAPTAGTLIVAASLVRFVPNDAKVPSVMPDIPASKVAMSYDPRTIVTDLRTDAAIYRLAFQAFCLGCTAGTSPIDIRKGAQLEAEYGNLQNSLTNFQSIFKSLEEISAKTRIGVTPRNQPTVKDTPEAMALYSELNQKLAALCSGPARSCVQNYQKYQACKGADPQSDCGDVPTCSAFCAITPKDLTELKAGLCLGRNLDSAALVPDWSQVAEKMEAAQKHINLSTLKITQAPPGPPLDPMGKPIDPNNPCSVESSYASAMMLHITAPGRQAATPASIPVRADSKVAGPSTSPSSAEMDASIQAGLVRVSGGVMRGAALSQQQPVYPPVAKAAHVQGAVVLHAIISKQGTVETLEVISGPPMLTSAAVDAVKNWTYRPYRLKGEPTEVDTTITVNFGFGDPPSRPAATSAP